VKGGGAVKPSHNPLEITSDNKINEDEPFQSMAEAVKAIAVIPEVKVPSVWGCQVVVTQSVESVHGHDP